MTGNVNVLVVDDSPELRELISFVIKRHPEGWQVVATAAEGRQAVDEARTNQPDLVLLDIAMPVMDGLEAAQHLRALESPPAVIFCTAYDEHALAAFEASAVDYLVKPVRRERLAMALERARRFTGERHADLRARLPEARQRSHICARVRGSLKLVAISDVA